MRAKKKEKKKKQTNKRRKKERERAERETKESQRRNHINKDKVLCELKLFFVQKHFNFVTLYHATQHSYYDSRWLATTTLRLTVYLILTRSTHRGEK